MPLQPGATNPMDSAQIAQNKTNQLQNQLAKVGGGRRRSRRRRRATRRTRRHRCARCGRMFSNTQHHNRRRRRSRRTRHHYRGGAPMTTVPPVSTNGVPDGGATAANMKAITQATINQNVQSGFDACVGKGPGCTAEVYTQQQQLLKGGCGTCMHGGDAVRWGCMS